MSVQETLTNLDHTVSYSGFTECGLVIPRGHFWFTATFPKWNESFTWQRIQVCCFKNPWPDSCWFRGYSVHERGCFCLLPPSGTGCKPMLRQLWRCDVAKPKDHKLQDQVYSDVFFPVLKVKGQLLFRSTSPVPDGRRVGWGEMRMIVPGAIWSLFGMGPINTWDTRCCIPPPLSSWTHRLISSASIYINWWSRLVHSGSRQTPVAGTINFLLSFCTGKRHEDTKMSHHRSQSQCLVSATRREHICIPLVDGSCFYSLKTWKLSAISLADFPKVTLNISSLKKWRILNFHVLLSALFLLVGENVFSFYQFWVFQVARSSLLAVPSPVTKTVLTSQVCGVS